MVFLKFDDLKAKKGIPYGRPHIWKLCNEERFPKPVKFGRRCTMWIESEIDAWLAARVQARDVPPPPPHA